MKKIIAMAMAALMVTSMTATAFAADTTVGEADTLPANANTEVTFNVDPTYTVTIPTKIELAKDTTDGVITYKGNGEISTSDATRLKFEETIDVKITSDFIMETEQGATHNYTVKKAGADAAVVSEEVLAKFETKEEKQSVALNYEATNPKYAGEYKDTVTFTISINANKA